MSDVNRCRHGNPMHGSCSKCAGHTRKPGIDEGTMEVEVSGSLPLPEAAPLVPVQAYQCPRCEGEGRVPPPDFMARYGAPWDKCCKCRGSGIVWRPSVKPKAEPSTPQEIRESVYGYLSCAFGYGIEFGVSPDKRPAPWGHERITELGDRILALFSRTPGEPIEKIEQLPPDAGKEKK